MMDDYKNKDHSADEDQEGEEMSVTEAFRKGQQSLAQQPVPLKQAVVSLKPAVQPLVSKPQISHPSVQSVTVAKP